MHILIEPGIWLLVEESFLWGKLFERKNRVRNVNVDHHPKLSVFRFHNYIKIVAMYRRGIRALRTTPLSVCRGFYCTLFQRVNNQIANIFIAFNRNSLCISDCLVKLMVRYV